MAALARAGSKKMASIAQVVNADLLSLLIWALRMSLKAASTRLTMNARENPVIGG